MQVKDEEAETGRIRGVGAAGRWGISKFRSGAHGTEEAKITLPLVESLRWMENLSCGVEVLPDKTRVTQKQSGCVTN